MKKISSLVALLWIGLLRGEAQVPENLVVEGVPLIPAEFKADAGRYLEFRGAAFHSWHPVRREMLITTRFADTPQLHRVKMPGADGHRRTDHKTEFSKTRSFI